MGLVTKLIPPEVLINESRKIDYKLLPLMGVNKCTPKECYILLEVYQCLRLLNCVITLTVKKNYLLQYKLKKGRVANMANVLHAAGYGHVFAV
jgi:hypothetical protein